MKPKKKKTKKVKSPNSKRKSKSKIQVLSNEEVSTIENLGIDLGAGLSKKELAAIKKAGIDLRADGEKYPFKEEIVKVNVFDEAGKVKNFSQLERFFELYMPGVSAADAAKIVTKYIKSNRDKSWTLYKILKDPEYHGEIFKLLHWIDTKKGGAPAAYKHRVLRIFAAKTGYEIPPSIKTFQNEVTIIKEHFGLARHRAKSSYSNLGDREFSIFNKPKNS